MPYFGGTYDKENRAVRSPVDRRIICILSPPRHSPSRFSSSVLLPRSFPYLFPFPLASASLTLSYSGSPHSLHTRHNVVSIPSTGQWSSLYIDPLHNACTGLDKKALAKFGKHFTALSEPLSLNLPAAFTQPGRSLLAEPCMQVTSCYMVTRQLT